MLAQTAQNDVRRLSGDDFDRHSQAGALFSEETAEVI
jgi:hypothetical protein